MKFSLCVNEDFHKLCEQMEFDLNLKDYKKELIDWKLLNNIIILCNQFFYINDFDEKKNIYVHPQVTNITGYSANDFYDVGFIYDLIHPEDKEFVYEFSKRTIEVSQLYKEELKENPFQAMFSIDFRLKHKNGNYIKLSRQSSCLKTDHNGNMVLAIVFYTDISQIKVSESYNIFWQGDTKYALHFEDLIKKYQKDYQITKREKDILQMLAKGETAKGIAEKLFISEHTVISHRKHLLKKTGTKNTPELIRFLAERMIL